MPNAARQPLQTATTEKEQSQHRQRHPDPLIIQQRQQGIMGFNQGGQYYTADNENGHRRHQGIGFPAPHAGHGEHLAHVAG